MYVLVCVCVRVLTESCFPYCSTGFQLHTGICTPVNTHMSLGGSTDRYPASTGGAADDATSSDGNSLSSDGRLLD